MTPPDDGASLRAALQEEQEALDRANRRRETLLEELGRDLAAIGGVGDPVQARRGERLRQRRAELLHSGDGIIFGRLDGADGAVRRIGRVGISRPEATVTSGQAGAGARSPEEASEGEPLVIDWRAPVARPFYTATAVASQGQRRRRHIRIADGRVVALDDEPLQTPEAGTANDAEDDPASEAGTPGGGALVGEGALLSALSQRRSGRMGTAVATLQAEQDEIIRADPAGPLIVQGGPGTGKTVVALHRVAYLLFSYDQLPAAGVLVLGPSARFLAYISQVLPALGETAVVSTTADALLPGVPVQRAESRHLAEIKGRAIWQPTLERYVADLIPAASSFPELRYEGEVYRIPAGRVAREIAAATADRSYHEARARVIERLEEVLLDAVVDRAEELMASMEDGFEDILQRVDSSLAASDDRGVARQGSAADVDGVLSEEDVDRLRERIADEGAVVSAVLAWWPARDPGAELAGLLTDRVRLRRAAPWLDDQEVDLICADAQAIADGGWAPSDVPWLDALGALLGRGSPAADHRGDLGTGSGASLPFTADRAAADPDWIYGHVVVDEAQELSPMQWHMVARRAPSLSITAVGDIDQAEAPHPHTTWAQSLAGALGQRWRERELTLCYRTPREVMDLTVPVLRAAGSRRHPPRAVRASGIPPREIAVTDQLGELGTVVAELVGELTERWAGGSVGIVAPTERVTALRARLEALAVPVLSPTEAKGLEWDAAVVVDPDGISAEPRGWNRLYVALTRCTQELVQVRITP